MPMGLDYFASFDAFSLGAFAIIQMAIFVYIFTYLGVRGSTDKPLENAGSITLAFLVSTFLLSLLGVPAIATGLVGVIAWSLASRHYMKMERRDWIASFIVLWIMLVLFSALDDFSRWGLVAFALAYKLIESELKIRKGEKDKKDSGKEKKGSKK